MAKARTGTMRQRKPGVWQLIASIEKKQRLIDNLTKMDRLVQRIEDRQRKYETFHGTEAEAQARLAAMQAESDGADESPSKDTVAGLMADWMRSESYRWKGGTRVRYRGLVSQHIVPFLGNRVVVSLKARDIQDFYSTLREQGRSESTIASVHSVLTAVFAYGIDVHELEMPKNPCDRVKLPRAKKAEVKVMVDEFPQGQVPGEGGRQKQAGIGHQAMVVKEDADTVGFVLWQRLLGAPCFRAGFCSKTIIPDSEEHPLASSRAVPKDVLRWIRA